MLDNQESYARHSLQIDQIIDHLLHLSYIKSVSFTKLLANIDAGFDIFEKEQLDYFTGRVLYRQLKLLAERESQSIRECI